MSFCLSKCFFAVVAGIAVMSPVCASSGAADIARSQVENMSTITPFELSEGLIVKSVSSVGSEIVYSVAFDVGASKLSASDRSVFGKALVSGGCRSAANRNLLSQGVSLTFDIATSDGSKIKSTLDRVICKVGPSEKNAISVSDIDMLMGILNKRLPLQVDSMTSLRSVGHDGKKKVSYEYEVSGEMPKIENASVQIGAILSKSACVDGNILAMLNGGVSLEFVYFGKDDGTKWFSVPITKKECSQS